MFNFNSFMLDIAVRLREIQHSEIAPAFHRITNLASLEEMLQNMQVVNGFQLIIEDVDEGSFLENDSALLDNSMHRFYVVKHVDSMNWDKKEEAKKQCKNVAKKIISKIRYNNLSDNRYETNYGLKNLDRNSFMYFSIGPLLDNFWGIEISFNLTQPSNVKYDESDWL